MTRKINLVKFKTVRRQGAPFVVVIKDSYNTALGSLISCANSYAYTCLVRKLVTDSIV